MFELKLLQIILEILLKKKKKIHSSTINTFS